MTDLKHELENVKKELSQWKLRITLATDFNQTEMEERSVCAICNVPFHTDYCYDREEDGVNVCDVCYQQDPILREH